MFQHTLPSFHRNFTKCSSYVRRNNESEHPSKGDDPNSAFPQLTIHTSGVRQVVPPEPDMLMRPRAYKQTIIHTTKQTCNSNNNCLVILTNSDNTSWTGSQQTYPSLRNAGERRPRRSGAARGHRDAPCSYIWYCYHLYYYYHHYYDYYYQ